MTLNPRNQGIEGVISIYERLPSLRKKVLDRLIVGYSTREIAATLFPDKANAEQRVTAHLREIYKNFSYYLKNADKESKRAHLIILFYTEARYIVDRKSLEIGSPVFSSYKPKQFEEVYREYDYEIKKVSKEEIPTLQVLGRKYFNSNNHLPTRLLESWYDIDSNNFRKIKNKRGRTVGFFILLFLNTQGLELFSQGKITEKEIKPSYLHSWRKYDLQEERDIYVSVVVGETGHFVTNICILLCLAIYLDSLSKSSKIGKLYGLAATDEGGGMMRRRFNFSLCTPGSERKDEEDFFEVDISSISGNLFKHLISIYPEFDRYASNIDLSNASDWEPICE